MWVCRNNNTLSRYFRVRLHLLPLTSRAPWRALFCVRQQLQLTRRGGRGVIVVSFVQVSPDLSTRTWTSRPKGPYRPFRGDCRGFLCKQALQDWIAPAAEHGQQRLISTAPVCVHKQSRSCTRFLKDICLFKRPPWAQEAAAAGEGLRARNVKSGLGCCRPNPTDPRLPGLIIARLLALLFARISNTRSCSCSRDDQAFIDPLVI